jgi:hypothetical protein
MRVRHPREVLGVEKIITLEAAHQPWWDYPPRIGTFCVIGRTCGLVRDHRSGYTTDMLTAEQRAIITRILGEPFSVAV